MTIGMREAYDLFVAISLVSFASRGLPIRRRKNALDGRANMVRA